MSVALTVDVTDFGAESHPDDYVVLYSPVFRPSARPGGLVSTAPRRVYLVEGQASVDVEPGPLVVEFHCRNIVDSKAREFDVPDEGGSLAALLEAYTTYTPPVVSRAVKAASDAAASASAASKSESSALEAKNAAAESIAAVELARDEATGHASIASEAQRAAELARDEASGYASTASEAQEEAEGARDGAVESAREASQALEDIRAIPDTVSWDGDRLTVGGKQSESLRGPAGKDGDVSFEDLSPQQKASLKGDKGDKGDPGPVGERGPAGEPGADGRTPTFDVGGDYRLTVDGVSVGPSLRGPAGQQGDPGPAGPPGADGSLAEITGIHDVPGLESELQGKASSSEVQKLRSLVSSGPKIQVVSSLPYSPNSSTIYVVRS